MFLGMSRTPSTGALSNNIGHALTRTPSTGSLTNALKKFTSGNLSGLTGASPGLSGALHATSETDIVEEETGYWTYMVIDAKGIRAHADASYTKDTKAGSRFPEGAVIEVDRRRKSGWTMFLGIKGCEATWLFDISPKDKKVRMVAVEVSIGAWTYEACESVPLLKFPTTAAAKASKGASSSLIMHEVVCATKRVRPVSGKGSFLKLADGRGWVLDFIDGHRTLKKCMPDAENSEQSSSSSSESPSFLSEPNLGAPELGKWSYVVLDPKGMSLRNEPVYDTNHKIERRIHEGEVVVVNERRAGDGMTFLHLDSPQGWAFDMQPGKKSHVRMMEAHVENGLWHYVVSCESGIALRTRCSFSDSARCGKGPAMGALLEICQRVRIGETTFLQLKDGGRWVFDTKGGRKVLIGPVEPQELPAGTLATVRKSDGVYLLQSPTRQRWAIGKMMLLPQARVTVTKLFDAEFAQWGFISKPGSRFEGWVHMDDLCLEDTSPASSSLRSIGSTPPMPSTPVRAAAPQEGEDLDTPEKQRKTRTFTKAQCQEAFNAPLIGAHIKEPKDITHQCEHPQTLRVSSRVVGNGEARCDLVLDA